MYYDVGRMASVAWVSENEPPCKPRGHIEAHKTFILIPGATPELVSIKKKKRAYRDTFPRHKKRI